LILLIFCTVTQNKVQFLKSYSLGGLHMDVKNTVITIGREFGSGGREIGERLAKELNIAFYDKELLDRAAKESGICQELFQNHDEKPTNSFLYSLVMDTYSMGYASSTFTEMPINHKIFLAQFDTIKKIAQEGPCVIVGRCADYALEDNENCLSIFIHASLDKRIQNIEKNFELTRSKAKDFIHKTDKQRASYYNYYTSKKWSDSSSYNLCVDSGSLGIDGTIELIKKAIELKEKNK